VSKPVYHCSFATDDNPVPTNVTPYDAENRQPISVLPSFIYLYRTLGSNTA
jgi:hypothetical protein